MNDGFGATPEPTHETYALPLFARAALDRRSRVFAIKLGNKTRANLGWADRFTFVRIGAVAESFRIHHVDHSQHAILSFRMALRQERQVRHFRRSEKHRRSIRTGCCAGAPSDARRRFHSPAGVVLGY